MDNKGLSFRGGQGVKGLSLRLVLFSFLCLLSIVTIFVGGLLWYQSMRKEIFQKRVGDMRYRTMILTDHLSRSYQDGEGLTGDMISKQISGFLTQSERRFLYLNRSLRVLYDSMNEIKNKTLLLPAATRALTGKSYENFDDGSNFIEIVLPIFDNKEKADSTKAQNASSLGDPSVRGVVYSSELCTDLDVLFSVFRRNMWILGVLIFLVSIPLNYIFSGLLLRPIRKLSASLRMVRLGESEIKVEPGFFAETRDLQQSFEDMVETVQNLEESRRTFVSDVSHELKTPITSMKLLADSLLAEENVPAEMYKEFLTDISEEVDREVKIIADLLALVKSDSRAATLNVKQVSINTLIEQILKSLNAIAKHDNVELIFESFRPVNAFVDKAKIRTALVNLVENAIKYNSEGGWVRVSLNADHRYFYITVADCGEGIPEEAVSHIFDRFYRVDKARSRDTGGTGLGLAITKQIVQLHGGTIQVTSRVGEGTSFVVQLPILQKEVGNV